jgi:hypothetical protein
MAEVKIKGIANVKQSVINLFNKVKSDEALLVEIGNKTAELTKQFNYAGKDIPGNKSKKSISNEWAERKDKLKATNKASKFYRSGASNLTFTGQLIESIKFTKINKSQSSVTIEASGERTPYKNLSGKITDKARKNTPTNEELSEYVKDGGRPLFGVNKQMNNVLSKIVRLFLNKKIRESIFKSSKG